MDTRKVQLTGGSTFTVSLPKDWAEQRLEPNETVFLDRKDSSLEIRLSEETESKKRHLLELGKNGRRNLRQVIACYVSGAETISASHGESRQSVQEFGDSLRESLIGMEIVEQDEEKLLIKHLSDISQFSTWNLLRRIRSVEESLFSQLIECDKAGTENMEQEIDRLHLLGVRQLHSAIDSPEEMEELGLESGSECLSLRLVLRDMERIGDHLNFLSKNHGFKSKELEKVFEVFQKSQESLFSRDPELAEEAIEQSMEVDGDLEADTGAQRSIKRINRLSKNIAENSLNKNFDPPTVDESSL